MRHCESVMYGDEDGLLVTQYVPSEAAGQAGGANVKIRQGIDPQHASAHRPEKMVVNIEVAADKPAEFTLKLRLPWWMAGKPTVTLNGKPEKIAGKASSFASVRREWGKDTVRLELPRALTLCPLPGSEDLAAFMDGPLVLAGLTNEQRTLAGDRAQPADDPPARPGREWGNWNAIWQTHGQERNFPLVPIHEVVDEKYTMYFSVKKKRIAISE